MSTAGLSSGLTSLRDAAIAHFQSIYQIKQIHVSEEVDPQLQWIPTLHFKVHEHLTVIAEASETPYPVIIALRRVNVQKIDQPISIFVVCPEESYLTHHADAKRLMNDGYGLITVSSDGTVQSRAECIPVIQQISEVEFSGDIKQLPMKIRTHLAEAFLSYKHSAPQGAAKLAEVFEGLVLKAGREAAGKTWISNSDAKPGNPARTLQALSAAPQFANASAAIGAAQAFIAMYRNISHHFPKNPRQAAKKYRDCRHGFLEGLKKMTFFREAMRNAGLTGGI